MSKEIRNQKPEDFFLCASWRLTDFASKEPSGAQRREVKQAKIPNISRTTLKPIKSLEVELKLTT
jgi:hypothetical protein